MGKLPEVTAQLGSQALAGLPSPGWAQLFPKDNGPADQRWPWMAELGGEGGLGGSGWDRNKEMVSAFLPAGD